MSVETVIAGRPGSFEVEVPIRWGDLDAQAHVNNAALLEFLQEARVRFLRSGAAGAMLDAGVVVTAHQVEYVRPVAFSARPLTLAVGVTAVGAARFTVAYDVLQDGQLCVRARTTCCPFDFRAQRPRRLDAVEHAQLEGHLVPAPALRVIDAPPLAGGGHLHELAVRWSDQDQYGHINNVLYFDYFQEARVHILSDAAVAGPQAEGMVFLVRQDVDYLTQLRYRSEPYFVRSAVTRFGNSSVTMVAEIVDSAEATEARPYARAVGVLVFADAAGVPTPVPEPVRAALAPYLVPPAPFG